MDFSLFASGSQNEISSVDIKKISPNPFQPRKEFSEEDIKELASSVKSHGIIQPVLLRKKGECFQLIAGERRLRAARVAGLKEIPAIINDFSDKEIAELALVENLQRKDLSFIEEARGYKKMLEQFDITQQELANRIGKSQSTIANKIRLLNLPSEVLDLLDSPKVSERHARLLLQLEDENLQINILKDIINNDLTVRNTKSLIKELNKGQNKNRTPEISKTVYRDLRLFKNTLEKTLSEMEKSGLEFKVEREKEDDFFKYTIYLPYD